MNRLLLALFSILFAAQAYAAGAGQQLSYHGQKPVAAAVMSQDRGAASDGVLMDLHTHTICSDGVLTPEQLVSRAHKLGINYFAIADHDTTACVAAGQAVAKKLGMKFVPAVEISVGDDKMHMLALNVNIAAPSMNAIIEQARESRNTRLKQIVEALNKLGLDIDAKNDIILPKLNKQLASVGKPPVSQADADKMSLEELQGLMMGQITRPDMAAALIAKGYVNDNREAFDKYLGDTAPAGVAMNGPKFQDTIKAIHDAGGIAILAHPYTVYKNRSKMKYSGKEYSSFKDLAKDLLEAGLDGFEAYRPGWQNFPGDMSMLKQIVSGYSARELILTAGSDFHGGGVTSVKDLNREPVPGPVAQKVIAALHLN